MADLTRCHWVCGMTLGGMTPVFAQVGDEDQVLIACFSTWELAQSAVGDHNRALVS